MSILYSDKSENIVLLHAAVDVALSRGLGRF